MTSVFDETTFVGSGMSNYCYIPIFILELICEHGEFKRVWSVQFEFNQLENECFSNGLQIRRN